MDRAKMANSNTSQDNSDDLIAELARLMAQDAQGEPEAQVQPKAANRPVAQPHVQGEQKFQSSAGLADGGNTAADGRTAAGAAYDDAHSGDVQSGAVSDSKVSNDNAGNERAADDTLWSDSSATRDANLIAPASQPATPADETFSGDTLSDDIFSQLAQQLKTIGPSVSSPPVSGHEAGSASSAQPGFENAEEAQDLTGFSGDTAASNSGSAKFTADRGAGIGAAVAADPIAQLIASDGERGQSTPPSSLLQQNRTSAPAGTARDEFGDQDDFGAQEDPSTGGYEEIGHTGADDQDDDRFAAPPVNGSDLSGLGSAGSGMDGANLGTTARASDDPISEIEALIGEAVRAGWKPETPASQDAEANMQPAQRQPAARAAVDGAEGRSDALRDATAAVDAALGAAALSSAKNKWAENDLSADDSAPHNAAWAGGATGQAGTGAKAEDDGMSLNLNEPHYPQAEPRRGVGRLAIGGGVLLLALIGAGTGYWFMQNQSSLDTAAPVLASNIDGAKVAAPAGNTAPSGQASPVFSELNGTANTPPANEQLVSRDQSAGNDIAANANSAAGSGTGAPAGDVRQVGTPAAQTAAAPTGEQAPLTLTNRKVRTVTVLPDGTIVSEDTATAGNQVLPVDRPNVPALPGNSATQNGDFKVASAETATTTPVTAGSGLVAPGTADTGANGVLVTNAPYPAPALAPATRAQLAAAIPAQQRAVSPSVSAGAQSNQQAVDLLSGVANNAVSSAPARTSATTASAPASDPNNAPAYVQLASQRSPDTANASLSRVQARFSQLFGGNSAFVRQVDLGAKGTFYRVLVPASSLASANQICASIKGAGGDCFVRNK